MQGRSAPNPWSSSPSTARCQGVLFIWCCLLLRTHSVVILKLQPTSQLCCCIVLATATSMLSCALPGASKLPVSAWAANHISAHTNVDTLTSSQHLRCNLGWPQNLFVLVLPDVWLQCSLCQAGPVSLQLPAASLQHHSKSSSPLRCQARTLSNGDSWQLQLLLQPAPGVCRRCLKVLQEQV